MAKKKPADAPADPPQAAETGEDAPASAVRAQPYKVIALKYRPQTFDDLVGQTHVKRILTGAITQSRIAHAFLFAGSRGTGKTTTARILAKAINCLGSTGPTTTPCGHCQACIEIAGSHDVDVMEIDGASNNGVEQVRELLSNIENKPARDRCRIIIIDEVHMLSTAAFNALLKTLEEPPPHVKFIFATTDPHKVPATIQSRCQHYDFRRLSIDEIVGSLRAIGEKEGIRAEPGVLEAVAAIAEGGMRDAQSKLDQLIAFRGETLTLADVERVFGLIGRARLISLLSSLRTGDATAVLGMADEVFSQGKDLGAFLGGLIRLLRDGLVLRRCGRAARGLDLLANELDALESEAKRWNEDALVYALEILSDAGRKLKNSDMPRVTLEVALLKLCDLSNVRSVADAVAALTSIARDGVKTMAPTADTGPARATVGPISSAPLANAAKSSIAAPTAVAAAHAKTPTETARGGARTAQGKDSADVPAELSRAKALVSELFEAEDDA